MTLHSTQGIQSIMTERVAPFIDAAVCGRKNSVFDRYDRQASNFLLADSQAFV